MACPSEMVAVEAVEVAAGGTLGQRGGGTVEHGNSGTVEQGVGSTGCDRVMGFPTKA